MLDETDERDALLRRVTSRLEPTAAQARQYGVDVPARSLFATRSSVLRDEQS